MNDKLRSICTLPFVVSLGLLLLNDFYFKSAYHNWLTGKLSDVCGLYVFASFWAAIFPNKKRVVYLTTALLFSIWKSPYSQGFIDFFSDNLYTIYRTVDFSDLFALFILPLAFFYVPGRSVKLTMHPAPFALLSVVSFCATSIPQPTQVFTQPQYLLFKSGIIKLESSDYPSNYQVYELDSLLVIGVEEIEIERRAALDDEYHKAQILKDLDLRLLKAAKAPRAKRTELEDYIKLRDSVVIDGVTSVDLPLDSVTEHLNFAGTRLEGVFTRLSHSGKVLIEGRFKNGIEDSIWSFYDPESRLILRKYFENGELTKTESLQNAVLISARDHATRQQVVRNKYFHIALITLAIAVLVTMLVLSRRRSAPPGFIKVSGCSEVAAMFGLPIVVLVLARFTSSLIPNSYSPFFLGVFVEGMLIYVVAGLLFIIVFTVVKFRNWFDLIYYVVLFALLVVLIEEGIYLGNISS